MKNQRFSRRNFIIGSLGAGLLSKTNLLSKGIQTFEKLPKIKEYRTLGRTGFKASDISCGPRALFDETISFIGKRCKLY